MLIVQQPQMHSEQQTKISNTFFLERDDIASFFPKWYLVSALSGKFYIHKKSIKWIRHPLNILVSVSLDNSPCHFMRHHYVRHKCRNLQDIFMLTTGILELNHKILWCFLVDITAKFNFLFWCWMYLTCIYFILVYLDSSAVSSAESIYMLKVSCNAYFCWQKNWHWIQERSCQLSTFKYFSSMWRMHTCSRLTVTRHFYLVNRFSIL